MNSQHKSVKVGHYLEGSKESSKLTCQLAVLNLWSSQEVDFVSFSHRVENRINEDTTAINQKILDYGTVSKLSECVFYVGSSYHDSDFFQVNFIDQQGQKWYTTPGFSVTLEEVDAEGLVLAVLDGIKKSVRLTMNSGQVEIPLLQGETFTTRKDDGALSLLTGDSRTEVDLRKFFIGNPNVDYKIQAKIPFWLTVGSGKYSSIEENSGSFSGKGSILSISFDVNLNLKLTGPGSYAVNFNGTDLSGNYQVNGATLVLTINQDQYHGSISLEAWKNGTWMDVAVKGGNIPTVAIWIGP